MFGKLEPILPRDAAVLAPNGPFPISEWIGTDWKTRQLKLTYCWHFYEPASGSYLVPPDTALSHLSQGITAHGFGDTRKTVIGFSQGGYVAQYSAQRLSRVDQVISLGCEFLPDDLAEGAPFRLDGIYGDKDRILDPERAVLTHRQSLRKTQGGELITIPGLGHEIDERVASKVADLLMT
jgi:predicted esterase